MIRLTLRPMTNLLPTSRGGIEFSRRLVATSMNLFGPVPKGTRVDLVADGPVRGEWVRAPGLAGGPRVIQHPHRRGLRRRTPGCRPDHRERPDRGDARHLHSMIDAAGGRSELEIWPDQMHVFQALPRSIPEAEHALEHAADFIDHALETTVVQQESKEQVSR